MSKYNFYGNQKNFHCSIKFQLTWLAIREFNFTILPKHLIPDRDIFLLVCLQSVYVSPKFRIKKHV